MVSKQYYHIDLPPDVQAFKDRLLEATAWEKTTCGVTFYKMYGRHFVRSQSSLTGKRVRRSKKFVRTMYNAGLLAKASEIVSTLYSHLTDDWRCHEVFRKLTGIAIRFLHQGKNKEEVQEAVYAELVGLGYREVWPVWELPPNLLQWVEEDGGEGKQVIREQALYVNRKGQLMVGRFSAHDGSYTPTSIPYTGNKCCAGLEDVVPP